MLVEVGVLYIALARPPQRCEAGERLLCLNSGDATVIRKGTADLHVLFGSDLEYALARDLALVKEVRHVSIERADNNLLIWIALDDPTREVRERVFRKELELIEGFPEIDFDFNVVPAMGRDPRHFASGAKIIYSREDTQGAD
jgi:hypothetical protein